MQLNHIPKRAFAVLVHDQLTGGIRVGGALIECLVALRGRKPRKVKDNEECVHSLGFK